MEVDTAGLGLGRRLELLVSLLSLMPRARFFRSVSMLEELLVSLLSLMPRARFFRGVSMLDS